MKSLGNYELRERLGVGGMAEVFLADARRQGNFSQPCVVKVLHRELARDENFTRLLLEEARLIARLRHNNIASLYDVGRESGTLFLVMEFVDGRDLHAILATSVRKEKRIPIPFAVHVAKHLCRGLHFAHTRRDPTTGAPLRLVHRDVSPQNVLVSVLGEVKLIDFGVAKFNSALREQTRAGVIKGKFGYMSPEQAFDEPLDGRSDLFSLGICLYEMLTSRSLYGQSDDPIRMLKRARAAAVEPVRKLRPQVPRELAEIVHRALSKNRDDRFQNAHALERALARFQSQYAPDYTNLDAGSFLRELFDARDPALDEFTPSDPASPGPPAAIQKDVEETTRPMADVPEEVRHSSSFAAQSRTELTIDAEEPTRALIFDENAFTDEATELFDENRISGAHPTIERKSLSLGRLSKNGRDPSMHTREIKEPSPRPTPRQDDEATNPTRSAARRRGASPADPGAPVEETHGEQDAITAERKKKPISAASAPRRSSSPERPESHQEPEGRRNKDESLNQESAPGLARQERRRPETPATMKSPALTAPPQEQEGLPKHFRDRKVQLIGASIFVVLAFLFVLSRFLF